MNCARHNNYEQDPTIPKCNTCSAQMLEYSDRLFCPNGHRSRKKTHKSCNFPGCNKQVLLTTDYCKAHKKGYQNKGAKQSLGRYYSVKKQKK